MESLSVDQSDTLQQLQKHHQNLPVGNQQEAARKEELSEQKTPTQEPPQETQQEAQPEVLPEQPVNNETFEVDGQTFANEKEAMKYLTQKYSQAEQDNLLLEARLEGMQAALQNNPQQTPAPAQEMVDDLAFDQEKYYEDPAGYIAEYTRKVSEASERKIDQRLSQREQDAQAWNTFTSKYPELAQFQGDVLEMYNKHRDTALTLAKKSPEKAMDFIAMKTKEKFQRYVDSLKPTRTLSNTHQGPSVGSNTNVTPAQKEPSQAKKVDFTAQLRNLRRK